MEENNSKEINLLQLIDLFFNWLKKIGKNILNCVGYIVQLSYKYKIIMGIVILICFSYGFYLSRPSVRVYKAEAMGMLVGTDAQTTREVCRLLENSTPVNKLISLSTKLSLPDSVANNVVSIQSFYVIDFMKDSVADVVDFDNNHSLTDTTNIRMKDRVYFQIKTKSIDQLPQVQAALLKFLDNNVMMKVQFESKRDELQQQVQICNRELTRIDSLAKVSYFKESNSQIRLSNDKIMLGEQYKQLFYTELLKLQKIKSLAQSTLSNQKHPIELQSDFVVNPTPINGRVKYAVSAILIGYGLALILALFIENLKCVFTFLRKRK